MNKYGFKIGNVNIDNPLILAPMAGVSDLPFRILCKKQGVGLLYTEMVSAKAISYNNKNTKDLMKIEEVEHPIALQLFGNEPKLMAEVVKTIEENPHDIVDINMGCPVPKVVNNGEGSALLKNPKLIGEIVKEISTVSKKPVTCKIRVGIDGAGADTLEIAKIIEEAGASALAIHGRTREEYYSGKANWEIIQKVKENLSIPVIGNGDIDSPESAQKALEVYKVDGIMIGRATRGNPWLFGDILHYINTKEKRPRPTLDEIKEMILKHTFLQIKEKGEVIGIKEMRKHIAWYTTGMPHSSKIRGLTNSIENVDDVKRLLELL